MFIILCSQTLEIIIASPEVTRPVPSSIKYLDFTPYFNTVLENWQLCSSALVFDFSHVYTLIIERLRFLKCNGLTFALLCFLLFVLHIPCFDNFASLIQFLTIGILTCNFENLDYQQQVFTFLKICCAATLKQVSNFKT